MVGHIAAIPKQTYDLDRSNRFLVGNLPGNRLRGSYAWKARVIVGVSVDCCRFDSVPREFRLAYLYDRRFIAEEE